MATARHGAWRVAGLAAWLGLAIATGCTRPTPLEIPVSDGLHIEGDVVIWTTSEAVLGAVRYGRIPGQPSRVAYPSGAERADRAFTRQHRVRLLSVAAGDTIHLQTLSLSSSGSLTAGQETRFVIGDGVVPSPLLRWTMIDVGFGDSHLLTMPGTGRHVLIDAGERRDGANVEKYLGGAHVTRLDAVMATHIHEDHIGGMVGESWTTADGVLGALDVGVFLDAPDHSGSRVAYDELLATLASREIPREIVRVGDTDDTNAALAWDPAVSVTVLNAGGGRAIGGETESDWINNDSVVLRVTYGAVDLMLGGDAESTAQSKLVATQPGALDAEVLKVHHHGVADACEPAYLDAVRPRVGLVPIATYESSAGTLPSAIVLERLNQRRVDVYASDRAEPLGLRLSGDAGIHVTVITDGTGYEISIEPSASQHWPGGDWAEAREAWVTRAGSVPPPRGGHP